MEHDSEKLIDKITARLRKEYREANSLQDKCEENSTGWWYCEGRKIATEIALRTIGYEV